MINKKTQADHVFEDQLNVKKETRARIRVPGIESLHQRPAAELAAMLTTIIKSQGELKELHYVVGEYIEVVTT
jgi:hypothetical protein